MSYEQGDSLGLWPSNPKKQVPFNTLWDSFLGGLLSDEQRMAIFPAKWRANEQLVGGLSTRQIIVHCFRVGISSYLANGQPALELLGDS